MRLLTDDPGTIVDVIWGTRGGEGPARVGARRGQLGREGGCEVTVAVFLLIVFLSERQRARARGLALLALIAGCAEDLPVRKQEMALAAPGVYRLGLVLAGHHLPQASAIMAGVGASQAERLGAGCASHAIEGVTGSESTKVKPGKDGADPEVEELTMLGAWLRCGAGR